VDGETHVWDLSTRAKLPIALPRCGVARTAACFSDDGSKLARAGGDWLKVVEVASGELLADLEQSPGLIAVQEIALSPDNRYIAQSDPSGCVQVWDLSSRTVKWHTSRERHVITLAFTGDSRWLLAGTIMGELLLYEADSGALHSAIPAHEGAVAVIRLTPEGDAVTAGYDGCVREWEQDGLKLKSVRFQPGATRVDASVH
jgi:WD40 repeat protein